MLTAKLIIDSHGNVTGVQVGPREFPLETPKEDNQTIQKAILREASKSYPVQPYDHSPNDQWVIEERVRQRFEEDKRANDKALSEIIDILYKNGLMPVAVA